MPVANTGRRHPGLVPGRESPKLTTPAACFAPQGSAVPSSPATDALTPKGAAAAAAGAGGKNPLGGAAQATPAGPPRIPPKGFVPGVCRTVDTTGMREKGRKSTSQPARLGSLLTVLQFRVPSARCVAGLTTAPRPARPCAHSTGHELLLSSALLHSTVENERKVPRC